MSYYFNKITDLIKNKVYVDKGPLETSSNSPKKENSNVININSIQKIPLFKEHDNNQERLNMKSIKQQTDQNCDKKSELDFDVR
jgi:hypothetical protein